MRWLVINEDEIKGGVEVVDDEDSGAEYGQFETQNISGPKRDVSPKKLKMILVVPKGTLK